MPAMSSWSIFKVIQRFWQIHHYIISMIEILVGGVGNHRTKHLYIVYSHANGQRTVSETIFCEYQIASPYLY